MDHSKRRKLDGFYLPSLMPTVSFDSDEASSGSSDLTVLSVGAIPELGRYEDLLPTGIFEPIGDKARLEVYYVPGTGYRTEVHDVQFSPITPRVYHPQRPKLINTGALLPKVTNWVSIARVDRDENKAVYQRKYFVLEFNSIRFRSPAIPKQIYPNHHSSNHTNAFAVWYRKAMGCYMMGNSTRVVHSEVFEHEVNDLVSNGIQLGKQFIHMKSGVFNLGGYPFVLCNGEDPKGIIKSMDLKQIFEDVCIRQKDGIQIVKRCTRGNRAIDLGRTGGQSQNVNKGDGIAEPNVTVGTNRYPRLWVAGSELASILADKGGFDRPMSDKKRNRKFSCQIHKRCLGIEHMTIVTMVHDDLEQRGILDLLLRHLDRENDSLPLYNYVVCAWDTFFVHQLGRNVTIAIVWTTRKSVGDHIERQERTHRVAGMLMEKYNKVPKEIRMVTKLTMPLPQGYDDFEVLPVHFDPLVDLSPYIHWVSEFQEMYQAHLSTGLPTYRVDDLAYAFLMTNNRLRFHRYCAKFFQRWECSGRFPLKRDDTFSTNFSSFLLDEYGGHNGTTLTKQQQQQQQLHPSGQGKKEFTGGVTRCQPFWNSAVPSEKVLQVLHRLHQAINEFQQKAHYGPGDFQKLFKVLQEKGMYLGQLNSVKYCYMLGAIGRISSDILRYGQLGSDHHKPFNGEPWYLTQKEHIDQVSKHMCTLTDNLGQPILPCKVDEFFCMAVGKQKGEAVYIRNQPLFSISVGSRDVKVKRNTLPTDQRAHLVREDFAPLNFFEAVRKKPKWVRDKFCQRGCNFSSIVVLCNDKFWKTEIQVRLQEKAKNVNHSLEKFRFQVLSDLCFDNQFFALADPLEMAAEEYGVLTSALERSITIEDGAHGYVASLDQTFERKMRFNTSYVRLGENEHTTPTVGLVHYDRRERTAYYETKWTAKLSVLYNLLFNHSPKDYRPLSRRILCNCHQYIVVFPAMENKLGHGLMYSVVTKQQATGLIERRPLHINVINYQKGTILRPMVVEHS